MPSRATNVCRAMLQPNAPYGDRNSKIVLRPHTLTALKMSSTKEQSHSMKSVPLGLVLQVFINVPVTFLFFCINVRRMVESVLEC